MALELFMVGLIVKDMGRAIEFYRRLGLAVPEGSEEQSHVEIKMGRDGFTFFLDSRPDRWDAQFAWEEQGEQSKGYRSVLEFYLKGQEAVEAKYAELVGFGYQGVREPYQTVFGMCFAIINDPDGNALLLSGDTGK
ncbi:VOC family protein [Tengunoibacter tsumagoiensis]|uniref:Glyoxalase n=1 Tax=Tengunoibacter tsumagoiensis TaxID=2014871 RepID=A0A402A999_9CHLR|nr:VOC family protein [Tengunoibacter tsumagoiensis]GCE15521.1 glyoxalase [Tengunoibacter tsumagoiensis]